MQSDLKNLAPGKTTRFSSIASLLQNSWSSSMSAKHDISSLVCVIMFNVKIVSHLKIKEDINTVLKIIEYP